MTYETPTPGFVLKNRVLKGKNITQDELATALGVSRFTVNQILNSRRSVTPEMAVRLGYVLGTSPELWMNLQQSVDLREAQEKLKLELRSLSKLSS